MIVQTKKEAWEAAKKMYKTEYHKDIMSSYHEGHPIYTDGRNIFIEDFGVRLNVKKDADKTDKRYEATNIWIIEHGEGITEEIEQEAERISDKIVLKPSHIKLRTNQFHKNTIFRIATQALKKMKTANSTEELFDICHEAEILLEKEIKECQGYLTIFEPLTKVMFRWRREGKICHKKCYCTDDCTAIKEITQLQTSLTI